MTTIITNHHWREFVYRFDVPVDVLESKFDWMKVTDPDTGVESWPEDDYVDGFLCYHGIWYHLSDFGQTDENGYHGCHSDSFFSGVLIRLSDDGEQYQIATYYS